jgi:hypothetical protein
VQHGGQLRFLGLSESERVQLKPSPKKIQADLNSIYLIYFSAKKE